MASEFDVYSFIKGQFGVEIVGQGKNGTYDTVHLYIQPFSKNNDKLAVDEYVGRYAETPSWSKIFALSENDLSNAIKIYNNYVVSSDRIDTNMIDKEIYKEMKMRLNDVFEIKESKKSTKKYLKESTDEDFSLYNLNKRDPFVKEWIRNINKELADVSIESIGDNEIVFRVWFDESMDLDVFDDIATSCMPRILINFMSDMNIDFGYQFVYKDDKFTENDFVFIRFVAW